MPDQPRQTTSLKPAMPRVPGVVTPAPQDAGGSASEPNQTMRRVLGIAVIVVAGGLAAYFVLRPSRGPSRDDRFAAVGGGLSKPAPAAPGSGNAQPAGTSRLAKGAITVQELAEPWSSKTFQFRSLTGSPVPAMIIRLPAKASDQTQSYWAFSLTEAYGSCPLEYITDLNRLSSDYGFQAKHPMVANPCKRALYDPLEFASMPTGALARGAIVHGSALRPPMAIDIRIEGGQIIPVQME